jgi:hypothetical protein
LAGLQGKSNEEMKTTYGAGAFVSSASDITFESGNIPGVGADPYIIGKLVGMAKGTTSKPIVGKNGVYVLQVTDIKDATPLDDAAIKANKKGAASAGQSAMRGKIATALEKIADIKDDRWKMGL